MLNKKGYQFNSIKNLILLIGITQIAFLMSCKKDYQCICTEVQTNGKINYSTYELNNTTRKVADESCRYYEDWKSNQTASLNCSVD